MHPHVQVLSSCGEYGLAESAPHDEALYKLIVFTFDYANPRDVIITVA